MFVSRHLILEVLFIITEETATCSAGTAGTQVACELCCVRMEVEGLQVVWAKCGFVRFFFKVNPPTYLIFFSAAMAHLYFRVSRCRTA